MSTPMYLEGDWVEVETSKKWHKGKKVGTFALLEATYEQDIDNLIERGVISDDDIVDFTPRMGAVGFRLYDPEAEVGTLWRVFETTAEAENFAWNEYPNEMFAWGGNMDRWLDVAYPDITYSGDVNVFPHGGVFMQPGDEILEDDDDGNEVFVGYHYVNAVEVSDANWWDIPLGVMSIREVTISPPRLDDEKRIAELVKHGGWEDWDEDLTPQQKVMALSEMAFRHGNYDLDEDVYIVLPEDVEEYLDEGHEESIADLVNLFNINVRTIYDPNDWEQGAAEADALNTALRRL